VERGPFETKVRSEAMALDMKVETVETIVHVGLDQKYVAKAHMADVEPPHSCVDVGQGSEAKAHKVDVEPLHPLAVPVMELSGLRGRHVWMWKHVVGKGATSSLQEEP